MNKEEMLKIIKDWEDEAGESFIDYFESNIKPITFMWWCKGKGYLDKYKMDLWIESYNNKTLEATCANYYISGYDVLFSIFPQTSEDDDENYKQEEKGLEVLAEFLTESDLYINRVKEFLTK